MKLLVDMNLSPAWIVALADAGIESVHWSTVGAYNASDREIMAFAKSGEYVVLTHDLDFGTILAATGGDKPSVVQIRSQSVSPEAIGLVVINAVGQMAAELESGSLLTVEVARCRLTLLPLMPRRD